MPINVGGVDFDYAEMEFGRNRGIRIWVERQANSDREYKLRPDPHDYRKYNKNKQPQFYLEVAQAIAREYIQGNRQWPPPGTTIYVPLLADYFTLEDR
jgi:hypothetical protein